YGMSHSPDRVILSYSQLIDQVNKGNVTKVDLTGQQATGTLHSAIAKPPPDAAAAPEASATSTPGAAATATTNGKSSTQTFGQFQTTLPPFDDPSLLPLLKEKGVAVQAHESGGQSLIASLLINALPLLLFGGLMFFIYRQSRGAQQQVFGFGRSRARRHNEAKPSVTFADVAGEDDGKQELTEVVDFLKEPLKYTKMGAVLPRGVLLIGPPGTGKTLLARAVAGEASVPFFSISGSEFVEMFVGVGASRVRDLFDQAKQAAPCIVFIDEIDAVGRQRGAGMGGGNDEREQTLNQILVEMDGFDTNTNVIVMAATNRPDVLDPALLRPGRFDRQVTVGLPDRKGREAILGVHTKGKPLAPDVDLNIVARTTPGFSGADLANLANEAALNAARFDRKQITMIDFEAALDKIVLGTKQAALLDEEERRSVAYHEGGHTLVALLTPGADPVNKVTIVPHGRALGLTQQVPLDDRHNYSLDYLIGRLGVMLGGRAAEEVVLNQKTTGAENDLKAASELARRMVGTWGMSDDLGPIYFGLGEEHPFLGRIMAQDRPYGDDTASAIDTSVRRIIEAAHQRALSLIREHRPELDKMVEALLHHETLTSDQLRDILARTVPIAVGSSAD
ncbi:MAG: ATP-dependent zinc metalloprotease FtsH, partial [Dehalococcoidia bacterium]